MAFKRDPTDDTFSSQSIDLTKQITYRDGGAAGKDEDLVNVFVEPVRNKLVGDNREYLIKRAGAVEVRPSVAGDSVRGMFFWEDQNKLYYAVSNDIYIYNVETAATATLTNPFSSTSGEVGFCLYLYDDNEAVVIATDGDTLIQIDSSNTVTTCADGDLPSPHIPSPIFMDGYLFLAQAESADIYNSNLNDPMLWTAGDFISAEMEGDYIRRLAKINNFLVALGSTSIEYFWDSAEASGSPLSRTDSPIKINSYLGGFAQWGNKIYFIGLNMGAQPDLFELHDFKITSLGTPTITRYMNDTGNALDGGSGRLIACKGHVFYCVSADSNTKTFVVDLETKQWARWSFGATGTFDVHSSTGVTLDDLHAQTYFAINNTSVIYTLDDSVYQDDDVNFSCIVTTPKTDFGTRNRKTMAEVAIIADRVEGVLSVEFTDNDYQSWVDWGDVDLDQDYPVARRMGSFRHRAFRLTYAANTDFRIERLVAKINKGRN